MFGLALEQRSRILMGAFLATMPWIASLAVQAPSAKPINPRAIEEGLVAWRTPGGRFNAACASCHAPDAFDLAQFGFDDATIRRRALAHVSAADAAKIVGLVHAIRTKYSISKPLDPMADRPLQPGGAVLPGATSDSRDLAFGESLMPFLPSLMTGRIESLDAAKKARDEVMAVDVRGLRIGIPMNRWSEDIFHGAGHGTVADWMPDVPCPPAFGKEKEWFAIVDRYIAEPTDEHFWALYDALPDHTRPFTVMPFSNEFAFHKYQSALLGQHLMRERVLGSKVPARVGNVEFGYLSKGSVPNPMWQVGEYAALNEGLDMESQGMPDEVMKSISLKSPFPAQMRAMKTPWMWQGWLQDQGLQRTDGDPNTHNARYFTLGLYTDGDYALHNCFMITRKQLVQGYDLSALPEGRDSKPVLDFSEFAAHRNAIRYEPQEPERQALFRTMAGNAFRMQMYLLMDDAKRTGSVSAKAIAEYQLQSIREYLIYSDPDHKRANVDLADRCLAIIDNCKDAGR